MPSDFQQEVETKEILERLHRKILSLEYDERNPELMITFRPDFQLKAEMYGGTPMYQQDHSRTIFLHPWFTDTGQEEAFMIWKLQ